MARSMLGHNLTAINPDGSIALLSYIPKVLGLLQLLIFAIILENGGGHMIQSQ